MSNLSYTIKRCFCYAAAAVAITGCSSNPVDSENVEPASADGGVYDSGRSADASTRDGSVRDSSLPMGSLTIAPSGTLTVDALAPQPISFTVRLRDGSISNLPVTWQVSPRELGTIDANTGIFTPSGAGGTLTVGANAGTQFGNITIRVVAHATQEGDPDFGKNPTGAGGIGGVGGEGGGSAVTDSTLRAALDGQPIDDPSMTWLYPYDGTVWPRGLPAPLLQWRSGEHLPAAVKVTITVDDTFESTLYLGPPATASRLDRLPIPQAIWRKALLSGSTMKLSFSYASADGAGGYKTYKATRELTWNIAATTLKGVVYYNSYATALAKNFAGAMGGDGRFGGATLAIEGDSYDPKLVAGSTTADSSGCRVCHSVSASGSTLVAQADTGRTSIYDLRTSIERIMPASDDRKLGWAALSPDGTIALGASGPPGVGGASPIASLDQTAVYNVADGRTLASPGLSAVATQAATPSFSPDGKRVAFNLWAGAGFGSAKGDGKSLLVMDVGTPDANTLSFSNPKPLFTATAPGQLPGWPFFLPDNGGVVFELELAPGGGDEHFMTRVGARGELWWTDLQGNAHALDAANGKDYLPTGPNAHANDATLQYEPTMAPIVAGGYAWVVFTSRRLYGNVATREPFESDPRNSDLTPGNSSGPTTKKLWVTAISIPAKPGTDPSHPAFYLPAQELFAGNSRAFWALNACKDDGSGCESGDECCGGYCTIVTEFGVCGTQPPNSCAKDFDKCNVSADCCFASPPLSCIAGRCAVTIPI